MNKSNQMVQKSESVEGLFTQKRPEYMPLIELTSPEALFEGTHPTVSSSDMNLMSYMAVSDRINKMENDLFKVTYILENMQKQNENYSGHFDHLMKTVEIAVSAIVSIVVALIGALGVQSLKRKKHVAKFE